jgi:hypothetical protein
VLFAQDEERNLTPVYKLLMAVKRTIILENAFRCLYSLTNIRTEDITADKIRQVYEVLVYGYQKVLKIWKKL